MAYTVTWVLTRPNAETALPVISDYSATNKDASDAIYASSGVTKSYSIDGLATTVTYEAADKATYDSAKTRIDAISDEASVKASLKTAMQSAGCTVVVTDSEGTELANF